MQRVLILQGNATLCQMLAELLETLDCAAEVATNEATALRSLEAAPPDALLIDPGWSTSRGATLLSAWYADTRLRNRPALVISGEDATDDLAALHEAYPLRMPFGLAELLVPLRALAVVP